MVVADYLVVLTDAHGLHVLSEHFCIGHRVRQLGIRLDYLSDGEVLGVLGQPVFFVLHFGVDFAAWHVP